jgi:hypothetical protein
MQEQCFQVVRLIAINCPKRFGPIMSQVVQLIVINRPRRSARTTSKSSDLKTLCGRPLFARRSAVHTLFLRTNQMNILHGGGAGFPFPHSLPRCKLNCSHEKSSVSRIGSVRTIFSEFPYMLISHLLLQLPSIYQIPHNKILT